MAKKKTKNKNQNAQQGSISPERFIRERARKLPLGECYATHDWQKYGIADVIVTRRKANGNFVFGVFLVDTYCLGVKDVIYNDDITKDTLERYLAKFQDQNRLEPISYDEAHNIIYGALEFASEAGIEPDKSFRVGRYILEEDTEDVPLIEYEFGKDGKYLLFVGPTRKEMPYIKTLKKRLGDNFDFVAPLDSSCLFDDDEYYDEETDEPNLDKRDPEFVENLMGAFDKWSEEYEKYPFEEYSYKYPEYPGTLSVKNQFIADELLSKDNMKSLPREVTDRILALPADEVADDLSNVILYTIGKTYRGINDKTIADSSESSIIHALLLLAHIGSPRGLAATLEVLRQNDNFILYHLGDFVSDLAAAAVYACGKDNIPVLEAFLYESGLDTHNRSEVLKALSMIVFKQPERRQEILEVFRRLLVSMESRLPSREACDGTFAGFVMYNLCDISAKELLPEIKKLFATDLVNTYVCGKCKAVVDEIEAGKGPIDMVHYDIPDFDEFYNMMK